MRTGSLPPLLTRGENLPTLRSSVGSRYDKHLNPQSIRAAPRPACDRSGLRLDEPQRCADRSSLPGSPGRLFAFMAKEAKDTQNILDRWVETAPFIHFEPVDQG